MTNKFAIQQEQYFVRKQAIEKDVKFPSSFRELLERATANYGNQLAVNFFEQGSGERRSFKELAAEAWALADGLHQKGIRHDVHVAVMLTNRVEFPVTWLALSVLGAVMIPLNTAYTGAELDYTLNDSDAEFLVLEDIFLDRLQSMRKRPTTLSDEKVIVVGTTPSAHSNWHTVQGQGSPTFRPGYGLSSHDLLNIQYTSGTTGFPKGCMQSQRYWILLGGVVSELIDPPVTNILTDHSYFYMDPLWQLVCALHSGATVHVAARLSVKQFLNRIQSLGIDMAWVPKPLINQPADPEEKNTNLKKLFIGGANSESLKRLEERFGLRVTDAYGMTEIGQGLAVPSEITDPEILGTCGLPAPFRECRVVDEHGNDVKPGEAGELWVKGDGVFAGYYNKPNANAESFVDGWFRTGDKFIQTKHGYFKIIGRFKDMIRRSSENVSALEVEQALILHPSIRQAAVVAVPDKYRGEEIKAYVLLAEGESHETVTPAEIIAHCETCLAAFKVPRYLEYATKFPYTPTMKVAKQTLIEQNKDLRIGSWDRLSDQWHTVS